MISALLIAVLAGTPAAPEAEPAPAPKRNALRGRFELSHTLSADSWTTRHFSWTDLRVDFEASRVSAADLWFRVDGRGRWSWNGLAEPRLFLSEVWLRQGSPESRWRFTLGRQTQRAVASAQVDGLTVEHAFTPTTRALAFAGLMPHPMTNLPNVDFTTAGLGYESLGPSLQHSGGVVLSLYRFAPDRLYLTERATLVLSPVFTVSGSLIADFFQPRGLVPFGTAAGFDLTSALLLLRFRPAQVVDLSLSASHQHTILPGRWWADWLALELSRRGFVIDGLEPVGSRFTTARLTANFPLTRVVVPFVRLRLDLRHNEPAAGFEGLAGLKLRPGAFFVLAQGGWRRAYEAQFASGTLELGYEGEDAGAQLGATVLGRSSLGGADGRVLVEAHAMAWLDLSFGIEALRGVVLSTQYQALFDLGFLYQVGFVQLGYRF